MPPRASQRSRPIAICALVLILLVPFHMPLAAMQAPGAAVYMPLILKGDPWSESTPTPAVTATASPTGTATPSPAATASESPTATATASPRATETASPTATATASLTATATPSPTATATATATPTATATATPTATWTPSEHAGIVGKVTVHGGVPPQPLNLDLEAYDGSRWSVLLRTRTAQDGSYLFEGAPSLVAGRAYRVAYSNNAVFPNPGAGYLWDWLGSKITAYNAGYWEVGGDFDVADVPLASPAYGAAVQLPTSFCWTARGLPGDNYRFMIYSVDLDQTAVSAWLGNVSCARVAGLPAGWRVGGQYAWWVSVAAGPDPDARPYNQGSSYEQRMAVIDW